MLRNYFEKCRCCLLKISFKTLIAAAKIKKMTAGMPRNINPSLVASIDIKTRATMIQANRRKLPDNPVIKVRMFHPL
jgi:hypothetical protein